MSIGYTRILDFLGLNREGDYVLNLLYMAHSNVVMTFVLDGSQGHTFLNQSYTKLSPKKSKISLQG